MSTDPAFAVLLDNVNGIEADMARGLLEAAGIPSTTSNPDFDVAELSRAAHDMIRGTAVLVPQSALADAQRVLEEAGWNTPAEPESEETH